MSDVWQGPGWWLASDGKWYPADAEPGAVYEGSLEENEEPAPADPVPVEQAAPAEVTAPAAVAGNAAESAVDASTFVDEPSAPQSGTAPVTEPPGPSPADVAAAPASTEDPLAQMPAAVIEKPKVGGWQSIGPEAPAAPIGPVPTSLPAAEHPVAEEMDEDGWTSAYEERQEVDVPEVGGAPMRPMPTAPPVDPVRDVQIPDVAAPAIVAAAVIDVPEVQISEVAAPMPPPPVEMPPTEIPDVQIPDVAVPTTQIPDTQIPEVAGAAAVIDVPEVQISEVAAPMPPPPVEMPPTEIPDVQIPDVAVPTTQIPDTQIPDLAAPVAGAAAIAGAAAVAGRDPSVPIERDGAWRKPSAPDEALTRPLAAQPSGVADVVDLAIPDEPREYEEPPAARNWALVGGIVIGVLAIAGLAWLIASVFAGDDDNNTNTGSVADDQDTTTVPIDAPSSEVGALLDNVSVFALRSGDCIVGDIGAGQVTKVTKVDCQVKHQYEVYREALIDPSITIFDEEAISSYAEEVCRTTLEAYIPADDDRGLKFKFLQPTEDSWNQPDDPDRVITCLLFDEDAPLVGRAA